MDYTHVHSEREREQETGMPIIMAKDDKTKLATAKIAPSKGVQEYAVQAVRKFAEQLGCNKVIMKSDSEPAILVLNEAASRERDER